MLLIASYTSLRVLTALGALVLERVLRRYTTAAKKVSWIVNQVDYLLRYMLPLGIHRRRSQMLLFGDFNGVDTNALGVHGVSLGQRSLGKLRLQLPRISPSLTLRLAELLVGALLTAVGAVTEEVDLLGSRCHHVLIRQTICLGGMVCPLDLL